MNKKEIIEQTKNAFDFLQTLYMEVSYFIKEVEGLLGKEPEEFIIGKTTGYGVTTNRSVGLEPANVTLWPMRKLSVFFIPKLSTTLSQGVTHTKLEKHTKTIYMRIVLDDKQAKEPLIYSGALYSFTAKMKSGPQKFEQVMTHIEYRDRQVFKSPEAINYEDSYLSFHGSLFTKNLYDLNTSEDIIKNIIEPTLSLYRGISLSYPVGHQ